MNKNLKTTLTIFSALFFSFMVLFIYVDFSPSSNIQATETNIHSSLQQVNEKRIFLIGSSYVRVIDELHIQQYLSDKGTNLYHVYNIGKGSSFFSEWVEHLDDLLLTEPTVVVFGIGFRELGYLAYEKNETPQCTIIDEKNVGVDSGHSFAVPKIQDASRYIQKVLFVEKDNFDFPNPKHVTIENLRLFFSEGKNSTTPGDLPDALINELAEFRDERIVKIQSMDVVNKPRSQIFRACEHDLDRELSSLNEMISGLKEKNVKVILFLVPYADSYLNSVGEKNVQIFRDIMENFATENEVKLYDLITDYTEMKIWTNWAHVAKNPKSYIYSEDVAKMILSETESVIKLRDVDVSTQNLMLKDLSIADLRFEDLSNKNLTGASLQNSDLTGANLKNTILKETNLGGANLSGANLSNKDLTGTILVKAILDNVDFTGVDLSDKDLTGASLKGVDLSNKDLTGTILVRAKLDNVDFTGVELSRKDLTGVSLSGVDLSNKDLSRTKLIGVDLSNKDLTGTILTGARLTGANLNGTDLSNKDLTGTILVKAILDNVDFTGVDLSGKDLTGANLENVNLSGKNLTGTILKEARLYGANLEGTIGGPFQGCLGHSLCLKN